MFDENQSARARQYRQQAAACLEWAERLSLDSDRARMKEMAMRWLELAAEADAADAANKAK